MKYNERLLFKFVWLSFFISWFLIIDYFNIKIKTADNRHLGTDVTLVLLGVGLNTDIWLFVQMLDLVN